MGFLWDLCHFYGISMGFGDFLWDFGSWWDWGGYPKKGGGLYGSVPPQFIEPCRADRWTPRDLQLFLGQYCAAVHSMEGFRYGDPKNWGGGPQMWEGGPQMWEGGPQMWGGVHSMEGFRYRDPKCVKGDPKSGGDPIKTPKMGEGSPKVGVGDPK